MLKLLMKKLGTPDSDPPSVEGSGGVSDDGGTPFFVLFTPAGAGAYEVGFGLWTWVTAVGGWECCLRTSGAGTVVVSGAGVAVVLVVVVLVVVVDGGVSAGRDGAGTVVVPATGGGDSEAGVVAGVPARALLGVASAASTARSGGNAAMREGLVIVSCRAGS
jgi:hypothetical protein